MRDPVAAIVLALLLTVPGAQANEICGEAPPLASPETAGAVSSAVFGLKLSSAAGEGFAAHARNVYFEAAKARPPEEARTIAAALLHGYCTDLMHGADAASLPWHVKDHFLGLSRLISDFRQADALLARIKAAEGGR